MSDMDMYELLEALEKQQKSNEMAGCYQSAYIDNQCIKMLMSLEEQVEDLKATRIEWIPVSERLPEVGQKCFYYFDMVGVNYGTYDGTDEYGQHVFSGRNGWLTGDVTHWLILDPPKEE